MHFLKTSKSIFVLYCLLVFVKAFSQSSYEKYLLHIKSADSLFKLKRYFNSAQEYSAAFGSLGGKGYYYDRYNASRTWAHVNYVDSAFFMLNYIVFGKDRYDEYTHLLNDSDLINLHSDKRWDVLIKKAEVNSFGTNRKLRNQIDKLLSDDQLWSGILVRYNNNAIPKDSIRIENILSKIDSTKKVHYKIIKKIVSKYGYPSYSLVGTLGSQNFWPLVQHQDNHLKFQQRALTLMKREVEKFNASELQYAYLDDRVKINAKELQIFGTQLRLNHDSTSFEPFPIFDSVNLEQRRLSYGLSTLEEYLRIMNIANNGQLKKK
jgi:hypothetical protein